MKVVSGIDISPLSATDFEQWLPLWDANNQGHKNEAVTAESWARLIDPASPVKGMGAYKGGRLAGFVHYILHPVTGHIAPVCYMQDLYVGDEYRKQGIGRALVEELTTEGKKQDWARMYWFAEEDNEAAQALYKDIGVKLNFSLHLLPL